MFSVTTVLLENTNAVIKNTVVIAALGVMSLSLLQMAVAAEPAEQMELPTWRNEPIQPLPLRVDLDPAKVALGSELFHDIRLSSDGRFACVTCHRIDKNGADGLMQAVGKGGQLLSVNTLTIFNSSLNHRFFWDGRAKTLQEQIDYVVHNPREFDTTWPEIVKKIQQDDEYVAAFSETYSDGMSAESIRDALAVFVRSLITPNSRFDRYLRGDAAAINADEKAGYQLFKAYGCTACHQGRNVGGNLFQKFGVFGNYFEDRGGITEADLGRFNVTQNEEDRHVFRVPSLRLAVLTPPYFHDGSAKTLQDAITVMAYYQLGRNIPENDIARIIAFLATLPGEYNGEPVFTGTRR